MTTTIEKRTSHSARIRGHVGMRKSGKPTVEDKVMSVLLARGNLASTEESLKEASGVSGFSFKEVVIRLERKKMIVKWKNESHVNHIVARQFARNAFYVEKVKLDPLYAAFGHAASEITVTRSIPFVLLDDDELGIERQNRYDL